MAIICVTALYLHNSFQQGFRQYLNEGEQQLVTELAEALSDRYATEQSWDFIQHDPAYWPRLMANWDRGKKLRPKNPNDRNRSFEPKSGRHKVDSEPFKFERRFHRFDRIPPRKLDSVQLNLMPLVFRVTPFDLNREPLIRHIKLKQIKTDELIVEWLPITHQGETKGWLRLLQPAKSFGSRASLFLKHQYKLFYWMAAAALVISLALALLLVRHFLKPVRLLVQGNQALKEGQFEHQLPIVSRDELGALTKDFNGLAQSLAEQKRLREQWLADISHELRTPLAVLRAELEAIQDGVRAASAENLATLHQHVMTLNQLVNDLHQLSLSDAGLVKPVNQTVNLNQVIKTAVDAMQHRLQEKSLQLNVNLPESAIWVSGSEQLLSQLLLNLIENSYRYTHESGQIVIALAVQAEALQLTIEDSAPGVPNEALPHLFERLFRVERSRSRELGGSGLGLSICEQIVQRHQGQIQAAPSSLGGLQICITLPLPKQLTKEPL